jgi:hypothetical protein
MNSILDNQLPFYLIVLNFFSFPIMKPILLLSLSASSFTLICFKSPCVFKGLVSIILQNFTKKNTCFIKRHKDCVCFFLSKAQETYLQIVVFSYETCIGLFQSLVYALIFSICLTSVHF